MRAAKLAGSRKKRTDVGGMRRLAIIATALVASSGASSRERLGRNSRTFLPGHSRLSARRALLRPMRSQPASIPYFLQGDFNGDDRLDLAVLVEQKQMAQQGIAILRRHTQCHCGGGGPCDWKRGPDFSWLDVWSIYPRQPIPPDTRGKNTPALRGDALLVQKLEAASALLYWDGATYRWHQQGD